MRAQQVMSKAPLVVHPATAVKRAAALLADAGAAAAPVVDEHERVLGVVTEADLLRHRFPVDPRARRAEADARPPRPARSVGEVMGEAHAVREHADLAAVSRVLQDGDHPLVPVVTPFGRLVGVVTRRDLLRVVTRPDTAIAGDLRHRLRALAADDRWLVEVVAGEVVLTDSAHGTGDPDGTDPTDRYAAEALAEGVPGVVHVEVRAAGAPAVA
ncbi:CBS domain-containing protein [Actinokineospora bangkokensis]|uniref:CBS domain-containing protein n=1 Tax=Actinokineospora bangkokensis TaxID=1193682 RepID=A0A1Q9LNG3_9PSEU|nr:CBS domain-containing protein [Actinokineospora bangkokensis]OLR93551.1 hypothetical protein BJP25_14750 [Actinokineospora bangkokensis]